MNTWFKGVYTKLEAYRITAVVERLWLSIAIKDGGG